MTKYIAKYCQDNNAVIDTLILFGHGGTNSMNIGLGRIGCFDASDIGEQRVMKGRQTLGLEQGGGGKAPRVREISVANQDHWGKCFEALTPFAAAHPDTGAFHVFLLACDLADNPPARATAERHRQANQRREEISDDRYPDGGDDAAGQRAEDGAVVAVRHEQPAEQEPEQDRRKQPEGKLAAPGRSARRAHGPIAFVAPAHLLP